MVSWSELLAIQTSCLWALVGYWPTHFLRLLYIVDVCSKAHPYQANEWDTKVWKLFYFQETWLSNQKKKKSLWKGKMRNINHVDTPLKGKPVPRPCILAISCLHMENNLQKFNVWDHLLHIVLESKKMNWRRNQIMQNWLSSCRGVRKEVLEQVPSSQRN